MSIQDKDYHLKWRRRNRERWNEYSRRYYETAKERIRRKRESPEYRKKLSDYLRVWRANNVEKRRADMKAWHEKNVDYVAEYRKAYGPRRRLLYQQQKEAVCARKRELSKTPKYRKRVMEYCRRRRRESIQFAIADRLRASMSRALRRQFVKKSARTFDLVGCTPTELRAHIERLFLPGMTWENRRLWHIDHKCPLSSFDLRDKAQQLEAFHFTNLQPLWAKDNQQKSDRW